MTENTEITLLESKNGFAGRVRRDFTNNEEIYKHVTKKQDNLWYIDNATQLNFLLDKYPMSGPALTEVIYHKDETATVACKLTIRDTHNEFTGLTRLAVTDNRNKAIVNPNSVDIHNTEQRARTKCIYEMTGLGWKVYCGKYEQQTIDSQQIMIIESIAKANDMDLSKVASACKVDTIENLPMMHYDALIKLLHKRLNNKGDNSE